MNRISQLLLKRLTGPLTEQDTAELERWAGESAANRDLYNRLTDPSRLKEEMDLWRMIDTGRPCDDMQTRVNAMLRPRRIMRRVAAAAAVIAVVAGLYILRPHLSTTSYTDAELAVTDTVTVEQIRHGVTRALLTDAGGNSVVLGEADTAAVASKILAPRAATRIQDLCLNVPRGGEFKVQLEDGTEVWLNSDSRLYYPQQFSGSDRRVRVEGEAYFAVATDSLRPFYVSAGSQVIRVYGTSFNVRSYPEEGEVATTLESGSVSLSRHGSPGSELYLTPGHQAIYTLSDSRVKVREVDTEVVTSWKNGRFVFENQTLLRIMQDLSRWYDFDYEFADAALEHEVFMGSIPRYSDFTTAIAILEKCGGIRFHSADGRVVISRLPS